MFSLQVKDHKMIEQNNEYLNLKSAAEYLGMSKSLAQQTWGEWLEYGVVPSRLPRRRMLYFKRSDLDRLMELTKVRKG